MNHQLEFMKPVTGRLQHILLGGRLEEIRIYALSSKELTLDLHDVKTICVSLTMWPRMSDIGLLDVEDNPVPFHLDMIN